METERIAFAPNFAFVGVLSNSLFMKLSNSSCLLHSIPIMAGAMISFTLDTALETWAPRNSFPPSLNSTASCSPVDLPEGTAARAITSPAQMSVSTVGFPLESRIQRAFTFVILNLLISISFKKLEISNKVFVP